MIKHMKLDITDEMLNQIKKLSLKEGSLTTNQYITKIITDYVLATKTSKKFNDNRYMILQLLTEEIAPLKERYERIMDRIEEDYVFIREGVNEDE